MRGYDKRLDRIEELQRHRRKQEFNEFEASITAERRNQLMALMDQAPPVPDDWQPTAEIHDLMELSEDPYEACRLALWEAQYALQSEGRNDESS